MVKSTAAGNGKLGKSLRPKENAGEGMKDRIKKLEADTASEPLKIKSEQNPREARFTVGPLTETPAHIPRPRFYLRRPMPR
jgi:hypothetical protein